MGALKSLENPVILVISHFPFILLRFPRPVMSSFLPRKVEINNLFLCFGSYLFKVKTLNALTKGENLPKFLP
jgi:hypothetical protein